MYFSKASLYLKLIKYRFNILQLSFVKDSYFRLNVNFIEASTVLWTLNEISLHQNTNTNSTISVLLISLVGFLCSIVCILQHILTSLYTSVTGSQIGVDYGRIWKLCKTWRIYSRRHLFAQSFSQPAYHHTLLFRNFSLAPFCISTEPSTCHLSIICQFCPSLPTSNQLQTIELA